MGLMALSILLAPLAAFAGGPLAAAPLGRATADFDNARPGHTETAFGRLAADALREETKADIALVSAGAMRPGKLAAGPIEQADLDALLSFGDDEIVTISITGAQLRAALERAVQAYPTNSPAFLHGSGFSGEFNAQAPINRRVTLARVRGREVGNEDRLTVALPISLAEGADGFFTIWNAKNAAHTGVSFSKMLANYIRARGDIAPDAQVRFRAQP
jgi:hypothetical protein